MLVKYDKEMGRDADGVPKALTLSSAVIVAVWLVDSVPLEWLSVTLREPLCDIETDSGTVKVPVGNAVSGVRVGVMEVVRVTMTERVLE